MKCNLSISLGIISIILIISITILILYKNMKNESIENFNNILDTVVITNNTQINNLMNQLSSIFTNIERRFWRFKTIFF